MSGMWRRRRSGVDEGTARVETFWPFAPTAAFHGGRLSVTKSGGGAVGKGRWGKGRHSRMKKGRINE